MRATLSPPAVMLSVTTATHANWAAIAGSMPGNWEAGPEPQRSPARM